MIQPLSFSSNLEKENKLFSQFNRKATMPVVARKDVAEVQTKKNLLQKK